MVHKNYCVYMHKNKTNGKVYIGITSRDPEYRWNYGKGYKGCPLFWKAIQKYGWNGFDHFILFCELTKEEAEQKEIEMIKLYKANDSQYGYNIQDGGSGGSSKVVYQYDRYTGMFLKKWENTVSIEKALQIPNANISAVCLGKVKTACDYYFSYEDLGNQLPNGVYEWINSNDCNVKVAQYDFSGNFLKLYDSAIEASLSVNSYANCRINFANKTNFGFIWKKVDENNTTYMNKLTDEELEDRLIQYKDRKKEVYQYDINGKFIASYHSITDAAIAVNGSQSSIASVCRGEHAFASGCLWKFATNAEYGVDLTRHEVRFMTAHKLSKKVIQYSKSGKFIREFLSVTEAAKTIGCSTNEISKVCMRVNKTVRGYIFRYDDDLVTEEDLKNVCVHKKKRRVEQYDMDDHYINTYESLAEASRQTGTSVSSITNFCNGKYKHANYYKWKYVD